MKKFILFLLATIFLMPFIGAQGTWTIMNTGNTDIPSDEIVSLGIGLNDEVFIGTPGGLVSPSHVYTYNGATWDELGWIGSINELKPNPLGYNSIATPSGVYHYDGTDYIVFDASNSNLTANAISCIDVAPDGMEYVGMTASGLVFSGGLGIYDGTGWVIYNKSNSPLPVKNVISVMKSQTGPLFIGTSGGGLVTKEGENWEIYDTDNSNIPGNFPICMAEASSGMVWVAFNNGSIATFDGLNFDIIKEPNSKIFPNATASAMLFDANQTLWVGFENAGLGKYNNTDWTFYTSLNSELPHDNVTGLELDDEGKIWISTRGGGMAVLDPQPSAIATLDASKLNIYPNPVETSMTLELQYVSEDAELTVYDMTGRKVLTYEVIGKKQTVDCSVLKPGYYLMKAVGPEHGLMGTRSFLKK